MAERMTEQSKVVLLVDDDDTVREVLAENLSQEGFTVFQAADGEEGVAKALQLHPHLIISDIVMPKMDGWDLCYTLRMIPSTRTIPFVFLSSLDKTPDRIMGLKLGADDYLTKPFTPEAVVFKVKATLRRLEHRQELERTKEAQVREMDARNLLIDMIEFLRHTQRTGLLAVYGMGEKGVINIQQGRPTHASMGHLTGEAAVYEILKMPSMQVKYHETEHAELEENLDITWETLMTRIVHPPT
jgi:CheY-like chemotaxis protein